MELFPRDRLAGIFRGFSEGGLEFHADLVLPYQPDFQATPMHGQFVIVALESDDEAVLGRITSIAAQGRLASTAGEDYGIRAMRDDRAVPEDLREQYLKYQVDIRVLGVLRVVEGSLVHAASHRRLPHVGSKVAFLSEELLQEVAGQNADGAELGFLALGEFVYAGDDREFEAQPWMRIKSPRVTPRFDVSQLVSRRSFVFARAGFGKSNLVKLLFSRLYRDTPTVPKRGGRDVPVGTVIFDPDGEYFWPDDKDRPGLCDVPELENQIVVFTNRQAPSDFYGSFVAGGIKLDIRRLRPADVIAIALPSEKQDQQNVRKLKALNDTNWQKIVDLTYAEGNNADPDRIADLLHLDGDKQSAELLAARANMTEVVRMLHDPSSQLMPMLLEALREGKLCVIDVSQMRGTPGLVLSGLILKRIFDNNQQEFTKAQPSTIPTIAVIEEAQSVLGSRGSSGEGPYVDWVKEGRKYDLGAVLVTQQPASLPQELLSQGDNWFLFHLLSSGDLTAAKRANAHFSDDILSSLLNEPLQGHGVFWSSAGTRPYPLPIRVFSFEAATSTRDPNYDSPAAGTYSAELREKYNARMAALRDQVGATVAVTPPRDDSEAESIETTEQPPLDVLAAVSDIAVRQVAGDGRLRERIETSGIPWRGVMSELESAFPGEVEDPINLAYRLVPDVLNAMFGEGSWHTEGRPSKSQPGKSTRWVVAGPPAGTD